jgi:hypothetical protein
MTVLVFSTLPTAPRPLAAARRGSTHSANYRANSTIPPDGQNHFDLSEIVSSPSFKNISVFHKLKSVYIHSHPVPFRGALRNVPARGGDAVDADGAPDEGA